MGGEEVKIVSAGLCLRRHSGESQEKDKEGTAAAHMGSRKGCVFVLRTEERRAWLSAESARRESEVEKTGESK